MKLSKSALKRMARGELPLPSEEEIQRVIADGLFVLGWVVYVTSRKWKRCHKCGAYGASGSGDGCSRGLADLIIRKSSWPDGICVALEVKRSRPVKWSSEEQRLAADRGDLIVVTTLEEAVAAVEGYDRRLVSVPRLDGE